MEQKIQIPYLILLGIISLWIFIRYYFSKTQKTYRRLKRRGEFEYWKNFHVKKGHISVSAHHGYKDNPDSVEIYDFDILNDQSSHYRNTDNGVMPFFSGTLKEGLDKYAPLKK